MTGRCTKRSAAMENMARVGIDLAKKVFHVTAMDDTGAMVERRKPRRAGLQEPVRGRKDSRYEVRYPRWTSGQERR